MPTSIHKPAFFVRVVPAVIALAMVVVGQSAPADERAEFFERQIRPLLVDNCLSCHGPEKQEGGIRLDSRQQVLQGTDDVDALVVPGQVDASRLMQVIVYSDDDTQMPPKQKLSDHQIGAVERWIASGAVWPEDHGFGTANAVDPDAWKKHWAFQPVSDPPMPAIYKDGWHPVDAFVRQRLQDEGIAPSPLADGRTLVRRISYAIVGLPPAREDLEAAARIADTVERNRWLDAYADRLLETPQYGERWARYWLDIARYADTKGYVFQEDREYKDAWRYRDWVINAMNDDLPYNEFLRRQIAVDKLPASSDPGQLSAMGFFTLGRRFLNNKHDIIDDRIDVLTRGTMALTVTCARCHDHKFDPIPTADYYSLYGVFDSSDEPKNEPNTLRLVDRDKPREPYVFLRGGAGNRGDRVSRHFLTALSPAEPEPFTNGSGRLELADRIASEENPLTARVAVNRIWLRLFGHGLVDSPSDFGVRTETPSHPELLDHLATWMMKNNWSRKAMLRYLVRSHTWRQSSAARADVSDRDPENRLLARMSRRRLDFEAFRDSLLSAAGHLDSQVGGESVDILKQPFTKRRTVYARIDRQNLPGTFRTFDFASPDTHAAKRFETTVPQQALFQLNSPFVMEQAERIVELSTENNNPDPSKAARAIYFQILGREPMPVELTMATQFITASAEQTPNSAFGWQYGWGELRADKNEILSFQKLPHFQEGRWSGGAKHPDEKLGWCMLTKDGGHTGHDLRHCPIRRWVADQDCVVHIESRLQHLSKNGDGVSGHIITAAGNKKTTHVHNQLQSVRCDPITLKPGDVIDFVADCGANESNDSFRWQIQLRQSVDARVVRKWESDTDFSGSTGHTKLKPLELLAQTLLLTNEFLFVD